MSFYNSNITGLAGKIDVPAGPGINWSGYGQVDTGDFKAGR
jgi:hypothetical protein